MLLLATWISWRERFSLQGNVYGFLSIVKGGMFSFPYIIHATYKAKGDPRVVLLGVGFWPQSGHREKYSRAHPRTRKALKYKD